MSRSKQPPKNHSAYVVTWSDQESVEVGSTLIDKGLERTKHWEWLDVKSGRFTSATGVRIARLCGSCRLDHRRVSLLDHDGECGSEEAKEAARPVLEAEKERVMAELRQTVEEASKA